jgi:hypothetical protein
MPREQALSKYERLTMHYRTGMHSSFLLGVVAWMVCGKMEARVLNNLPKLSFI